MRNIKFIIANMFTLTIMIRSLQINVNVEQTSCPISWLHFPSNENCLTIVGNFVPLCVYRELFQRNIRVRQYDSFDRISPLSAANKSDCERFLQTDKHLEELKSVFHGNRKFFYAFTEILIIHLLRENEEVVEAFNVKEKKYIYENVLSVYVIDVNYDYESFGIKIIEFKEVINVLTGEILTLEKIDQEKRRIFFENKLSHPFVDIRNRDKGFSVSFFNCSPHLIYFEDENKNQRFDGVDYRILYEITKNWKIKKNIYIASANGSNPYRDMVIDINRGKSDVGFCSLWMIERNFKLADLSLPYTITSSTLLVPIPTLIDDAAAIYYSLSRGVWLTYLLCLLLSGILLKVITKNQFNCDERKTTFVEYMFYLIGISTGHCINYWPRDTLIRQILISWMLMSLAIGTGYSTGYISMITNPKYSMPVDTVEQFLKKGYYYGDQFNHANFEEALRASGNPYYVELAKRHVVFRDEVDVKEKLSSGMYGVYAKLTSTGHLHDCEYVEDFAQSYRVMKSNIFTYFSVYTFQKDSPYRELFNHYIFSLLEMGVIDHWYSEVIRRYGHDFNKLFCHPDRITDIQRSMSLKKLSGAFYVLTIGYLIALAVFLIELFCHRVQN